MEKSKKEVQSTRSDNRMKQVRFLCQLLEGTKTIVPHIFEPENFDAPIPDEYQGYGVREDKLKKFNKHQDEFLAELRNFAEYLELTVLDTLTFCVILARQVGNDECEVSVKDINRYLDIDGLEGMPFVDSCNRLAENHYVERNYSRYGDENYIIYKGVIASIRQNDAKVNKEAQQEKFDKYMFCKKASEFIHDIEDFSTQNKVLREMEMSCTHLEFIQKLKDMNIGGNNRALFYEIANDCIKGIDSDISCTCDYVFCDNPSLSIRVMKDLKAGTNSLIKSGLIELKTDSFFDKSEMTLSDKGKEFFFVEDYEVFSKAERSDKKLIKCEDIPVREMFYDKELSSDIAFIEKSLGVEEFNKLQERMTAKAMSKGVAILFYGSPGTGKTETVMQLARRTGRKVYHVDISASKTCWYGESEKLIKGIFTEYKKMCVKEKVKPILLFNEADALLGKRRNDIHGSCDQTDNAIQNILLEEMEKLEGIMIATTNFEGNLDDAFERRFLMKVNFRKPSVESKEAIWHSKMPSLSQSDCRTLAIRYDLSGGEIDNVVRKVTMTEVLQGITPDLAALCSLCEKERFSKSEHRKVGF